VAASYKKLNL